VFSLAGCFPSEKKGKSIDDFWYATVENDGGEKYVRIWGLTNSGIKLSETQTEATIPETIGGYPVKHLKMEWFINIEGYKNVRAAGLGSLKRLIIEPCVRIGENFFGDNELDLIELKSEEQYKFEPELYGAFGKPGSKTQHIIVLVSDNNTGIYTTLKNVFKQSEVINGFLIREGVFWGYIGSDSDIIIPETVTTLATDRNFIKHPITSAYFPATINSISKDNLFSRFSKLTTVYVSSNTTIEDGAFMPNVVIERY
jgi:hypothetical protein